MSACTRAHLALAGSHCLEAAGIPADEARTEALLLLIYALRLSREELRLRPEREATAEDAARYAALLDRRATREPLAYITGTRAFYGLDFVVTPAVLIPRPETEFLVEAALRHIALLPAPRIADIGTGSGAIAISIAANAPAAHVWAADLSAEALAIAAENATRHGITDRITFVEGDLAAPLASFAPFDALVSNPPYIADADVETLMPEVRDWEPRMALGTHADDLHFYRRLAAEAPRLLAPDGLLAVEVGQGQAEAVADLWRAVSLADVAVINDYAGIGRVVRGITAAR